MRCQQRHKRDAHQVFLEAARVLVRQHPRLAPGFPAGVVTARHARAPSPFGNVSFELFAPSDLPRLQRLHSVPRLVSLAGPACQGKLGAREEPGKNKERLERAAALCCQAP